MDIQEGKLPYLQAVCLQSRPQRRIYKDNCQVEQAEESAVKSIGQQVMKNKYLALWVIVKHIIHNRWLANIILEIYLIIQ